MSLRIITLLLVATVAFLEAKQRGSLGSLQICFSRRGCIKPDVEHDQRGWHRGPVGPPGVGGTNDFEDLGGATIGGGTLTAAVGVSAPVIGGGAVIGGGTTLGQPVGLGVVWDTHSCFWRDPSSGGQFHLGQAHHLGQHARDMRGDQ